MDIFERDYEKKWGNLNADKEREEWIAQEQEKLMSEGHACYPYAFDNLCDALAENEEESKKLLFLLEQGCIASAGNKLKSILESFAKKTSLAMAERHWQ